MFDGKTAEKRCHQEIRARPHHSEVTRLVSYREQLELELVANSSRQYLHRLGAEVKINRATNGKNYLIHNLHQESWDKLLVDPESAVQDH